MLQFQCVQMNGLMNHFNRLALASSPSVSIVMIDFGVSQNSHPATIFYFSSDAHLGLDER